MDKVFDYLYIGTGPINIIDAVQKAQQGKSVVLVDSKDQIGGAWVAIEVGNYGKLEIGCHIWSYNQESYDFLKDFLGLNLVKLDPQPYFLNKNSKLIYDHKNALISTKTIAKHLIKGKFKSISQFIAKNPSARFPIIPKKYLYPKGGAREFQNQLIQKLINTSAETKMSAKIDSLEKVQSHWNAILSNGEIISAKHVTMTATSSLKQIICSGKQIVLKYSKLNYTHFHLILDHPTVKPLSYIRVLNHPFIHRISDITGQLDSNDTNKTVLLIGVFDTELEKVNDHNKVLTNCLDYLRDNEFISEQTKVEYSQLNKFETTYINRDQRSQINALDENLELLGTTDLIYGVHAKLKDWTT